MKTASRLALCAALAAAISLAGCQRQGQPEQPEATAGDQAPDAKPGIAASNGELLLPAVPGRPGAAYFQVRNDGDKPTALVAVYIEGVGKAEMHKTDGGTMAPVAKVDLTPGQEVRFSPGGLHVMAFEIADTLKKGDTTEMTLTFAGGDKLSMPMRIGTIGSAGGSMAGMDHGDRH